MWFKTKQQPIYRQINREFLRREFNSCDGGYGMGTGLDVFDVYAVEYEDLISGQKIIKEEYTLA